MFVFLEFLILAPLDLLLWDFPSMHKWQYISYQAPFLSNPSQNSSIACIRLNFSLFSFFFWPNFFTRCYYGSSAMLNSSTVDDKSWCREDSRQMPAAGCLILRTIPHLNGQWSERWEDNDKHKDNYNNKHKHNDKDDKCWCCVDRRLMVRMVSCQRQKQRQRQRQT